MEYSTSPGCGTTIAGSIFPCANLAVSSNIRGLGGLLAASACSPQPMKVAQPTTRRSAARCEQAALAPTRPSTISVIYTAAENPFTPHSKPRIPKRSRCATASTSRSGR
jgi:hypothetical protein